MASLFSSSATQTDPPAPRAAPGERAVVVAHVVRSLETGGAERVAAQLALGLDRARFRPLLIALQEGGWLGGDLERRGVRVLSFGAGEGLKPRLFRRLARALAEERVELVHCHNLTPLLYAGPPALLRRRCRLLLTQHGRSLRAGRAAPLARWLVRRAAAVVAVSEDVRALLETAGWRREGVTTVLNGVDTERFQPRPRAGREAVFGFAERHFVVGCVGRLAPEKDHATLLRAFRKLQALRPEARLVLAGDGPLRDDLRALARRLKVSPSVAFLGERRDLPELLPLCDAFCLSSVTEGTSLVLLEALACGLPAVATAVGGNPEVLADGETGLLVPPGEPERLAEALAGLAAEPERRAALGAAARRRVQERYGLARMVRRYEELYQEMLTRKAR